MAAPIDVVTQGYDVIHNTFQSALEFKAFLMTVRHSNVVQCLEAVEPDCTEMVKIPHILKFLRTHSRLGIGSQTVEEQFGLGNSELEVFHNSLDFVNDWRYKVVHCDNFYSDNFDEVIRSRDPELLENTPRQVFMKNLENCLVLLKVGITNRQTAVGVVTQVPN